MMAAVYGYQRPMRILCAREFQNSLKESSFAEVARAIKSSEWLSAFYDVGREYIRGANGTEFLFQGLARNIDSVKSLSDIDLAIVEEAEQVSEESWQVLIPTIRKEGSEIWVIWNRKLRGSATDQRFIIDPPKNSRIVELNFRDNPYFPAELEAERLEDKEKRPQTYSHIWEGAYLESTETHPFLSYEVQIGQRSPSDIHDMYRVISVDFSHCVGGDNFVIIEQGRDWHGNTYILDAFISNSASLPGRLQAVARMVKNRRPDKLIVERNTDSLSFIQALPAVLAANDCSIKIIDPPASKRGDKNSFIVSWLEPLFSIQSLFCITRLCDIIQSEMYSFDVTSKDNKDDVLDAIASGVRYLKTPDRPTVPYIQETGDPHRDKENRELMRLLGRKVKNKK